MEEIKVRLWYPKQKIMSVPLSIWNLPDYDKLEEKPVVLMNTQLKDKNGKEIFEGDIVKGQAYKDGEIQVKEVEFDEGQFYADIELSNRDFYEAIERGWVEVIGNKFENPDLLK